MVYCMIFVIIYENTHILFFSRRCFSTDISQKALYRDARWKNVIVYFDTELVNNCMYRSFKSIKSPPPAVFF